MSVKNAFKLEEEEEGGLSAPIMWFSFWRSKNRFTVDELRYLTDQLMKVQVVNEVNKDFVIEALRSIAELITYGDQHDTNFFEFFMEKQVMGEFVRILKISRTMIISLQLLQTMSIVIQNLKSEPSIYYLFSNEHINCLITYSFDFRNEELLSYYISFLRAISGKLNKNTISLLVKTQNEEVVAFPLYVEAIRFAFHEDVSIRLVHVLMTCAEAVQHGSFSLAGSLVVEVQTLLTRVNSGCGIGKVASFFIDALSRRIFTPQAVSPVGSAYENDILYHHFYEVCPYLKFAHFTANQAILEAFEGQDCVHVIDFNLMHGLQWPALIQALALRPGGPPSLRLTGIGQPSPDGRDSLREIGLKLAELARSVNVRFAFRGVAASQLDDVKPWMLHVSPKEAVAVNSIMQFHKLLSSDAAHEPAINSVLDWIRSLNPKIMTVVEQESNHNQPEFLDRFTEALYYYSTMFDSMEACSSQPETSFAELYVQREICNVVCCEGSARFERHEPLVKWKDRLGTAGFKPLHLGSNAYKQACMLLTLFSAEGYCVEENEGCLSLGWHSRPLIAASAWHVVAEPSHQIGSIIPQNDVL